jgi:hypothetical protein
LTQAIIVNEKSGTGLLKVAAGGAVTGLLTPLLPPLIDTISGSPGDFRIALVAVPFAILVLILVRRLGPNPWWAALTAAVVTLIAFVCAVNVAIWADGQAAGADKAVDNALDLDLTSFLYPVWQAAVAVTLATALRRTEPHDV